MVLRNVIDQILTSGHNLQSIDPLSYFSHIQVHKITTIGDQHYCLKPCLYMEKNMHSVLTLMLSNSLPVLVSLVAVA